jgi:hypothetical protein
MRVLVNGLGSGLKRRWRACGVDKSQARDGKTAGRQDGRWVGGGVGAEEWWWQQQRKREREGQE